VNPAAKLVQTDDLGTIYSTPRLRYQAEFENQRRWLAWDLLCGSVDTAHPMHAYLVAWGIDVRELAWLRENPCPPQIIGIDHYVTSDRFLDEDLGRYPSHYHGGNARERYADLEAVRVLERPGTSLRHIVLEAAQRYRLPIALTEVHIGCTEDEQVRWLQEAWTTCEHLVAGGVDVRAVTAWALLGCYDWDSLLTCDGGSYESGAYCLRTGAPRATAVARLLARLAAGDDGAAIENEGWWRRPERLLYGVHTPWSRARDFSAHHA
jgi:dTDP-4-dehydrorhamnose reductase